MNNFDMLKNLTEDQLAEWLDKYINFDYSPHMTWFNTCYCSNCEPVMCKYEDGEREFPCSYCELNGNCKFFPNLDSISNNKMIIKMWLETSI